MEEECAISWSSDDSKAVGERCFTSEAFYLAIMGRNKRANSSLERPNIALIEAVCPNEPF